MAGLPQHSCMVPGCAEVLLGLRGRPLQACSLHRSAVEVDIDGDPFRYCVACATLHPIKEFPQSSHLCKAKQQHYWPDFGRRRRLMRQRAKLAFTALQGGLVFFCSAVKACASVLGKALAVYTSPSNGNRDHGQEVYGLAAITFLGGQAPAARVALPILYSVACHTMGPRRAETLVSIALSSFFLHILLPYVHHYHYALPLLETRRVAAQLGLALSSSFEVLDHSSLRKYERFVRASVGSGYVASVGRMVGVLSIAALRSMQALEATVKVWGVPRGWLLLPCLLLVGLVYLPARLRALGLQRHRWSQWLDASLLALANAVSPFPMAYAWASGAHSCGTPDLYRSVGSEVDLAVLCLTGMIASSVILSALLDGPVGMVAAVIAAVTVLNALTVLISQWCVKVDVGVTVSSVTMVILVGAWLASGIVYLVLKVRQEKFRLLRYMQQLTEAAKAAEPLDSETFYEGDSFLVLAVKIGDVTPADLPPNLRWRVLSMFQVVPESLAAVIWPGCVLLGLEMRFLQPADLRAAHMALLSHSGWNETLLDRTSPAIDVAIQGSVYVVRDGRLRNRLPGAQGPSIASVEPLSPSAPCRTLTLQLDRLAGDRPFRVMLRCGGRYYKLDVVDRSPAEPSGRSTVVVRLPEASQLDGLAWLEVLLDTPDGSLMMSAASPVLFHPVPAVAEELSRVLPAFCPYDGQGALAGMLGDLAGCLQGEAAAPPRLLLQVAKLGMTECFKHIATNAAALRNTEHEGQGLLGSAVLSGSMKMLDLAISTLVAFRLPVNPCQRAPDARGYTALHWAAAAGHLDLVYVLLAKAPDPLQSWRGCRARLGGKTPAQLMAEAGLEGAVDEAMLQEQEDNEANPDEDPEEAAAAVWGADVAATLGRHSGLAHMSLLALYAAMCVQLGWQDPLSWLTVVLAAVALHILVPWLYKEVYRKGLAEVRGLAAEQGLAVSWAFRFLGAPDEQGMYEQFAAKRASARILSSCACTATVVLVMSAPMNQLLEHWGVWRHAPVLLGCAVLVSLLAFAVRTKRVGLWRWLEPAVALCSLLQGGAPYVAWIRGNPDLCMVPSSLQSSAQNGVLMLGLMPVVLGVLSPAMLATVPKAPGAPIHLPSEVLLVLFSWMVTSPIGQWCIASATGVDNLGNLSNILRVTYSVIFRQLMASVRLRAEKQSLCAFLAANARQKAEKGAQRTASG